MLLIITHSEDYTVDYVVNILNKRELPFLRLNTDFLDHSQFEVKIEGELCASLNGISEFSTLWFRRKQLPIVNNDSEEIRSYIALDYESLLFNLISVFDFRRL